MSDTGSERALEDPIVLGSALSVELLAISRRARDAAKYESAHHALAGALHGAESASDGDRLRTIQDEAARQQEFVDSNAPEHRLSRPLERAQGGAGWYDARVVQYTAVLSRERATATLDRSIARREG
jgi:hypothetical protein